MAFNRYASAERRRVAQRHCREHKRDIIVSTLRDWQEYLAGIDWDDINLDRERYGRLELLATEVSEGLRPEEEFWKAVKEA